MHFNGVNLHENKPNVKYVDHRLVVKHDMQNMIQRLGSKQRIKTVQSRGGTVCGGCDSLVDKMHWGQRDLRDHRAPSSAAVERKANH